MVWTTSSSIRSSWARASRRSWSSSLREARAQLDRIEEEVVQTKFPLDFTDRVYTLRQHVDYVRAQLRRQSEPHAKD